MASARKTAGAGLFVTPAAHSRRASVSGGDGSNLASPAWGAGAGNGAAAAAFTAALAAEVSLVVNW